MERLYPTLTIDECIDLLQKETANFERQLKKRQLEIAMRLKQNSCAFISDKTLIEIVNALISIVQIRLHGPESLIVNIHKIEAEEYYQLKLSSEVLNDICCDSRTEP